MARRLRYPELAPEGYAALSAFGHYINANTALEPVLLGLVYLRASVLNGCGFCTELHRAELRKHHEPESRIEAVSVAPTSEAFTPREQAALRWTEVLTLLEAKPVSDEAYAAISRFFEGKDLVDLSFAIANINAWNRMGIAFQPEWRPRQQLPVENSSAEVPPQQPAAPEPTGSQGSKGEATAPEDDGGKVASE